MPTAKPFPISNRSRVIGFGGGYGELYRGARQTNSRPRIQPLDADTPKIAAERDRRELMTISRHLFANFPVVQGVVEEIGDFAGTLSMRFKSDSESWNEITQQFLEFNDELISTTGGSMDLLRYLAVIAVLVDGDIGFILTESKSGLAQVQPIPGHRIGNRDDQRIVSGGRYDGAMIRDGVATNIFGTPIAYQVLGDDATQDRIYSARDFHLCFLPFRADQLRGIPFLASGIEDWQDVRLTKTYELNAQKLGAYQGLIEENETGEPMEDMAKQLTRSTNPTVAGGAETTTPEVYSYQLGGDGALVRWFKAGAGGLKAFQNDRPTANNMAFWSQTIREALCGIGYSYDFAVDPSGVSGAPARVVVDRINKFIARMRRFVVSPLQNRIDGYRIAKAIKNERLPFNEDWFRREYTGGAKLTADAKHQSDTNIQNIAAGLDSHQNVAAEMGRSWKTVAKEKGEFWRYVAEVAAASEVNDQRVAATNPKNPTETHGEGADEDSNDD